MGAAAILLLGTSLPECTVAGCRIDRVATASRTLAGVPLACVDALGSSALQRTMERLARAGITTFAAIVEAGIVCAADGALMDARHEWHVKTHVLDSDPDVCRVVSGMAEQFFGNRADHVFVVTLGGYAEFDPEEILQFSRDHYDAPVRLHDRLGPVGVWLLSARWAAREGYPSGDGSGEEIPAKIYFLDGYANRLLHPRDLRRMVRDLFQSRCSARPGGKEVKPGIWVEEGARVHRQARIVPPAYIGRDTRIGAATLITRSSSVERDCTVDYGTVVEDSSILADTYVGMGLDVTHSVVSGTTLVHLHQNLAMEIYDEILIGRTLQPGLRRAFRRHSQLAVSKSTQEERENHLI